MRILTLGYVLFFQVTLLTSCASDEAYPLRLNEQQCLAGLDEKPCVLNLAEYSLPNLIEARTFTLNAPAGWSLQQDQGIDTYVGRIGGPEGDTIYFDQGYLSFGSLDNIKENNETLYFRRLIVNGVPAIVEKEARTDDTGAVRLSIYLDVGDQKHLNRLSVFDPKNEALILQIFSTHRFL